jgi:hypothetical protein
LPLGGITLSETNPAIVVVLLRGDGAERDRSIRMGVVHPQFDIRRSSQEFHLCVGGDASKMAVEFLSCGD